MERPKAEALGYLEAKKLKPWAPANIDPMTALRTE
jgi:hypothetical protein